MSRGIVNSVVGMALLIALWSCGDDSGNNSSTDSGIYGVTADTLEATIERVVGQSADVNASLEYFTPYIAAILNPNAAEVTDCIPEDAQSKVFHFAGSTYVGNPNPEPDDGAFFSLYEIKPSGAPDFNHEIAQVYYNCQFGGPHNSFSMYVDAGEILPYILYGSGNVDGIMIEGSMNSRTTSTRIFLGGEWNPGDEPNGGELALRLGYSHLGSYFGSIVEQSTGGGACELSAAYHQARSVAWATPPPQWSFNVDIAANPQGAVTGGYATYYNNDSALAGLAACVTSGSLNSPNFGVPSTACLADTGILQVNSAELNSMRRIYDGLYEIRRAFDRCLAPIEPRVRP